MIDEELEKIRLEKAKKILMVQSMPKEIIQITSENHFDDLGGKHKDKIFIIDFWAIWCSPCMAFAPVFEKLQQEFQQEFIFTKVNVDNVPILANRYGITGIPTTLFIKNGRVVHKVVGAVNYDMMKNVLLKLRSI